MDLHVFVKGDGQGQTLERLQGLQRRAGRKSKNRRRRYESDSSESGHTQYALPKDGNALFNLLTF